MNIFDLFYISITLFAAIATAVIVGHWIAYIIIKLFKLGNKN